MSETEFHLGLHLEPELKSMLPVTIGLRSPQIEDAEDIFRIWIDRLPEAEPGYEDHSERRAMQFLVPEDSGGQRAGIEKFSFVITDALRYPERFYMQVATDNNENLVGYIRAEAPPYEAFTELGGLSVSKQSEGKGVASLLLDSALDWARTMVRPPRPVRALVAPGNQRSLRLFTSNPNRQFTYVGKTTKGETYTQEATSSGQLIGIPMLFDVMELGLPTLLGNQVASRQ
jgi:GNAT superfamily N-acetyltransferase